MPLNLTFIPKASIRVFVFSPSCVFLPFVQVSLDYSGGNPDLDDCIFILRRNYRGIERLDRRPGCETDLGWPSAHGLLLLFLLFRFSSNQCFLVDVTCAIMGSSPSSVRVLLVFKSLHS